MHRRFDFGEHSDNRPHKPIGEGVIMLDGQTQPSPRPSRRTLNTMLLAAASTPLLLREQLNAQGAAASAPGPFRLDIPQARRMVLSRVK
jgi:hypothetical protein